VVTGNALAETTEQLATTVSVPVATSSAFKLLPDLLSFEGDGFYGYKSQEFHVGVTTPLMAWNCLALKAGYFAEDSGDNIGVLELAADVNKLLGDNHVQFFWSQNTAIQLGVWVGCNFNDKSAPVPFGVGLSIFKIKTPLS
jgi:hypothetical protein